MKPLLQIAPSDISGKRPDVSPESQCIHPDFHHCCFLKKIGYGKVAG